MKFALLLYGDHAAERALDQDASMAIVTAHFGFGEQLKAAGSDVYGAALNWPDTGATVRADGIVTDGPFAEAQEQIGALYVIDCPDLATAVEWAKKVPPSPGLQVEVRPVLSFEDEEPGEDG